MVTVMTRPGMDRNDRAISDAAARELDGLLRRANTPAPSARLMKAVLRLPGKPAAPGAHALFTGFWRPTAFAFGAVLMAFVLGHASAAPKKAADTARIDRMLSSLMLASDMDFSEFGK